VIDVSQALLKKHVNAMEFLKKDIDRVIKYFERFGIKREDDEKEKILSRLKEDD